MSFTVYFWQNKNITDTYYVVGVRSPLKVIKVIRKYITV